MGMCQPLGGARRAVHPSAPDRRPTGALVEAFEFLVGFCELIGAQRTTMQVISVNVGLPRVLTYGTRDIHTGGDKRPVREAMLRLLNFDGDGQADLTVHGGPDRAVCVYSFDHYP